MDNIETKDDLLTKLRAYSVNPDDDTIRIKNQIKDLLMKCPELLYSLNEKDLQSELFTDDGKINWDEETHEPLGEWDRYFGDNSNIRPFLFLPDSETESKHYVCYQVGSEENVRYNDKEKVVVIVFTIFVYEHDRIDKLTNIPRHDLIASIIREKMAWTGLDVSTPVPIYDVESTTDSHYLTRTIKYNVTLPNSIVQTKQNGSVVYTNKKWL